MKEILNGLWAFLQSLSYKLSLFDKSGNLILGESAEFVEGLKDGQVKRHKDKLYLFISAQSSFTLCTEDRAGAEDTLKLAARLISNELERQKSLNPVDSALLRLVSEKLDISDAKKLTDIAGINFDTQRALIFISLNKPCKSREGLSKSLALEKSDILIRLDDYSLAIIKSLGSIPPDDDNALSDYASAVLDSLSYEEGLSCQIGIGTNAKDASFIQQSLYTAKQALKIGRVFLPKETVYEYDALLSQRLMALIPKDEARRQIESLAGFDFELSDEIQNAAQVFLENNLNLTEASKILYIHRNTLIYRLDKFQKQSGLDLRRFNDAFTYKLIYQLKQSLQND